MQGLITVSRLRNTAAQLGITEINQRGGSMLFYMEHPTAEMIGALSRKYRGRVQFGSVGKPYLGVELAGRTAIGIVPRSLGRFRKSWEKRCEIILPQCNFVRFLSKLTDFLLKFSQNVHRQFF